jgi:hypothetical protein
MVELDSFQVCLTENPWAVYETRPHQKQSSIKEHVSLGLGEFNSLGEKGNSGK